MSRLLPLPALSLLMIAFPITSCSAATGTEQEGIEIGQEVRDCADCPEMVAVPQVGHTGEDPGKAFYAGRFEITWREYLVAVRAGACPAPEKDFGGVHNADDPKINDDYPLTTIGSDVFPCYLGWLKERTGKTYRIPSAAEWEHVARAGTVTEYYWGDGLGYDNAIVFDYLDLQALRLRLGYPERPFYIDDPRRDVKRGRVYPVGQFNPNPWGLYDVIGSAAEITTETIPPVPACVKMKGASACGAVAARGSERARSPDPAKLNPPITQPLTTARFRTPAHGGGYRAGFRLVRD